MTDVYTEIKRRIRGIAGQHTPLLLTCKVESVDGETCTVSVGDLKLTDVRLRSVVNGESSKLLITPAKDSYVTIIDLSGELRETEVIGYSQIEAIDIETGGDINIKCKGDTNLDCDGIVTFNGGDNDGLVQINKLTQKLNQLVQKFNAHTHTTTATIGPSATVGVISPITSQASTFNKSDYEDTKVKH